MSEDNKEVELWSPDNFKGKVEERIREVFMDLMPPEVFAKMVSDSVDAFTKPRQVNRGSAAYPRMEEGPSHLEQITNELMRKHVREYLIREMNSDEWIKNFNNTVGKKLAELIKENASAILESMLTQSASA